jgi:hypothetical protein
MGFLDSIVNFFGGIGSVLADILAVAKWLFSIILYVAQVLLNFVVAVGNFLLALIGKIGQFAAWLWTNFFKGIFTRVMNVLQKAHDWLEQRLRPIINFLKKIRALQDAYFRRYLKPLLDMLQHTRQFLQLLRLLHISFAAQLDNYIAGLEARLAQTFATLRAAVNNAIDVVNLLADPTLLIRKPVLLLSIRRQLPALITAVTGRPPGFWFPSPRGAAGGAFAPVGSNYLPGVAALNPPVSSYLGFEDGIGNVPPLALPFALADNVVDTSQPVDAFNDSLFPSPVCKDPALCISQTVARLAHT